MVNGVIWINILRIHRAKRNKTRRSTTKRRRPTTLMRRHRLQAVRRREPTRFRSQSWKWSSLIQVKRPSRIWLLRLVARHDLARAQPLRRSNHTASIKRNPLSYRPINKAKPNQSSFYSRRTISDPIRWCHPRTAYRHNPSKGRSVRTFSHKSTTFTAPTSNCWPTTSFKCWPSSRSYYAPRSESSLWISRRYRSRSASWRRRTWRRVATLCLPTSSFETNWLAWKIFKTGSKFAAKARNKTRKSCR